MENKTRYEKMKKIGNDGYEKIATAINNPSAPKFIALGTFALFLFILICVTLSLLFPTSPLSMASLADNNKNVEIAFTIIGIVTTIFIILCMTIPNYADLSKFIGKLKFVFLLIFYIIGLIIFFRDVPSGIINGYAFIFLPIIILLGIYFFHLAINKGEIFGLNLNYERIKYALVYFCLIIFITLIYNTNPGGYITTYFGPSMIFTILLLIFGFLYLLMIMTFPSIKANQGSQGNAFDKGGFFKGFTLFSVINVFIFIIFLFIIVAGILAYPGGFLTNTNGLSNLSSDKTGKISLIVILLIIIFCAWIIYFGYSMFSDVNLRDSDGDIDRSFKQVSSIGQRVFSLLFGLCFSGILIAWLVTIIPTLQSTNSIFAFILNLLIIIAVLALVFKLITGGSYYKKSPVYRLIINSIFYIPCILVIIIDFIIRKLGISTPSITGASISTNIGSSITNLGMNSFTNIKNTTTSYYVLLVFIIFLYLLYFLIVPRIETKNAIQGGNVLVNNPIYLNVSTNIGSYQSLNGENDLSGQYQYDYNYAISCWVFINANTGKSTFNTYSSILDYGGKPTISYNASDNTMRITMQSDPEFAYEHTGTDASHNNVVYTQTDVLLQKWNNIIINYNKKQVPQLLET